MVICLSSYLFKIISSYFYLFQKQPFFLLIIILFCFYPNSFLKYMKLSSKNFIIFTEDILLLFRFILALITLPNIRGILIHKHPYFPELDDAKISWINKFKPFISSWWCIFYSWIMPSFTSYYKAFNACFRIF